MSAVACNLVHVDGMCLAFSDLGVLQEVIVSQATKSVLSTGPRCSYKVPEHHHLARPSS